ncbi:hypothetical protein FOA52_006360 [Chlamydomonas sp. UWO 241]|nr:hypothetical protein FOA52_006360 [Chlamydomonas sp. UWO 241]
MAAVPAAMAQATGGCGGAVVVIVCGVSGCGKSTVGKGVAERLRCPFYDADDFHSSENIAKMASGGPLTDGDRWPWLDRLAAVVQQHASRDEPAVLACSALKASYRAHLRAAAPPHQQSAVAMVLLDPPAAMLHAHLAARAAAAGTSPHFMPPSLLESQLEALERPPAHGGSRYVCRHRPAAGGRQAEQGHGDCWELVECAATTPVADPLLLHIEGQCCDLAGREAPCPHFPTAEECVHLVAAALRQVAGHLDCN